MVFDVILTDYISERSFAGAHCQLDFTLVLLPLDIYLTYSLRPSPQASHENLQLATAVALLKKDTKRLKAMAVEQGLTVPDTVQDGEVVEGQAEFVERPGAWDADNMEE